MLSWKRAFIVIAAVVGVEMAMISAVTAAQISGSEMEAMSEAIVTILTGFGLVTMTMIAFLWRMFKKWNPEDLDPIEMLFFKKIKKDADFGPVLERMERLEKAVAILVEKQASQANHEMGVAEYELKKKK